MTSQPHIVYVITRAHHGGAQAHVLDLLAFRSRARITVVSGEDGFLLAAARARGLATYVVPELITSLHPKWDVLALFALRRLLRQLKPDLVHLHSSKAGLLGRVAAHLEGVPAVFTAHGWAFTPGVSWPRRLLALLSEKAIGPWTPQVIAVSEFDRLLALRYRIIAPTRIVAVHNGLPPMLPPSDMAQQPESGALPTRGSRVLAIMVARFSSQKDQPLLIRALQHVPDLDLWLVGEGELLEESRALATELGVAQRVSFLGNRHDVPALLQASDVFCLSTHYEGFPISTLEAMRAELPVIATEVGGVSEAVLGEVSGLLIAPGDLAGWVSALQRLTQDSAERRRMGASGRQRFLKEFTSTPMLSRTWQVYKALWKAWPSERRGQWKGKVRTSGRLSSD